MGRPLFSATPHVNVNVSESRSSDTDIGRVHLATGVKSGLIGEDEYFY